MRPPNLNALRMFDAAARHLNFRRAAEEVNLTQGAVAQQVRGLEHDLSVKLFHRHARGLGLTGTGRTFHAAVRRALAIIDDATDALRPGAGKVTISVTPSIAAKWLVPRLGRFAEQHPGVELQINATEALADFRTDGVDIGIRQGPEPTSDSLLVRRLAYLDLVAAACPTVARQLPDPVDPMQMRAFALIQDSHRHWDRLLEQAEPLDSPRIVHFDQTALAIDAARNGQGIVLSPRLLLEGDLASGQLLEIWREPPRTSSGFYLVASRGAAAIPEISAVIAWIVSEAASLTARRSTAASD